MDIKSQILERLNSLYNFALDKETFDQVTFLGIGKTIQKIRFDKHAKDRAAEDNQLIEAFLNEYTNESHKKIARVILENQLRYLSSQQPDVGRTNMKPLLMGTAARLIKQLMVFDDIIGLQPMLGPVSQIFQMQYTYKDSNPDEEGNMQRSLALEIIAGVVEAQSRQLQAAYTIEVMQDLCWYEGLDMTAELTRALSSEIMFEIVNEIIADLVALANKNPATKEISERISDDYLGSNHEYFKVIMTQIHMAAMDIARKTRRGPGNVIITSAAGAAILQNAAASIGYRFANIPNEERRQFQHEAIFHTGNIVSTTSEGDDHVIYSVYVTLTPSIKPRSDNNQCTFLVGYKGNSATDTGYIYSPYVPIMSTGIVIDPLTFQPLVRMMTRYGKWVKLLKKETELAVIEPEHMVQSSSYYVAIEVDTNKMVSITEK